MCVCVYSRARCEDTATLRSRGVSLVHIPTQTTPLPTAQSLQLRVALYDNWALFRSLFFKIKISIFPATFPRCVFFFSLQLELAAQETVRRNFRHGKRFFFLSIYTCISTLRRSREKEEKRRKRKNRIWRIRWAEEEETCRNHMLSSSRSKRQKTRKSPRKSSGFFKKEEERFTICVFLAFSFTHFLVSTRLFGTSSQ